MVALVPLCMQTAVVLDCLGKAQTDRVVYSMDKLKVWADRREGRPGELRLLTMAQVAACRQITTPAHNLVRLVVKAQSESSGPEISVNSLQLAQQTNKD